MRLFLVSALLFLLFGCAPQGADNGQVLRAGHWYMSMDLSADDDTVALPFLFDLLNDSSGSWTMHIRNGEERIAVHEIEVRNDSIRIRLPLYDSEFIGRIRSDSSFDGSWYNYLRGDDYTLPFRASAGDRPRFTPGSPPKIAMEGEWKTSFVKGCCDSSAALGIFEQRDGLVTGTFATETGDHRFLEGVVRGDSLVLSVFNGYQANLFTAVLRNDSLIGHAYWGKHGRNTWYATRDPGFRLRNADSLTFLKEGHDMVEITLPDLDGRSVSPKDAAHRGKVTIVQILGSWCPNCVDEARLFRELYDKYHDSGLEIIGIAFERHPTEERSIAALDRFRKHLGINYPICYAGSSTAEVIAERLPFLNHVMSFPTSITIGRDGKVRRIYTGFYGPGTGDRYDAFRRDMDRMLAALLAEPAP